MLKKEWAASQEKHSPGGAGERNASPGRTGEANVAAWEAGEKGDDLSWLKPD